MTESRDLLAALRDSLKRCPRCGHEVAEAVAAELFPTIEVAEQFESLPDGTIVGWFDRRDHCVFEAEPTTVVRDGLPDSGFDKTGVQLWLESFYAQVLYVPGGE